MIQAYNFIASWQLFPEKCYYETGIVPKSGHYKIESHPNSNQLSIHQDWVSVTNEAFYTQYSIVPNAAIQPFHHQEMAEAYRANIINSYEMEIHFIKASSTFLSIHHKILPNGYLQITHHGTNENGSSFTNVEVYYKQMTVLPYAASLGSVAIKPTKEGIIKHKALLAMEDQTNMQLNQIKEQIELLAKQAQEIRKRKELSMMIYESKINFKPQIGQVYHLYEKKDGTHLLSLVAPHEWGNAGPFKQFLASVKLLADHTWVEVHESNVTA